MDFMQATLAKEILESNDISCIITGVSLSPLDLNTESTIKLIINRDDEERAKELIETMIS
jgi:hypothetical protein